MFEEIKHMQKYGVFRLTNDRKLDKLIEDATTEFDILKLYNSIRLYIKNLDKELSYIHNVNLGSKISDFSDAFSYEMLNDNYNNVDISNEKVFNITLGYKNKSLTRTINFGKAGKGTYTAPEIPLIGSEAQLIKLINHYYISLCNNDSFTEKYFYIPISSLMVLTNQKNRVRKIREIMDYVGIAANVRIGWDITDTKYCTDKTKDLCKGENEPVVSILPLMLPSFNKNAKDGMSVQLKGIICVVNKFMKMRKHVLNQISNLYPVRSLNFDNLTYQIAARIYYSLHLKIVHKEEPIYKVNLRDLIDNIKYWQASYFVILRDEHNKPVFIKRLLKSIISIVSDLDLAQGCCAYLDIVYGGKINLFDEGTNSWKYDDDVYEEMVQAVKTRYKTNGLVTKYILEGQIELKIALK